VNAAVLSAVGTPLRIEELRHPEPKKGEVRIRIAACGVCHSDLHIAKGDLKFPMPVVLGHEISGIVDALGEGVSGIAPGDRVVSSFIMPCGTCPSCTRGRDDLCETYFAFNRVKGVLYDGQTRLFRTDGTPVSMQMMGGMAQFAIVPDTDVFPLPASLPLEESCILGCALMNAVAPIGITRLVRRGIQIVGSFGCRVRTDMPELIAMAAGGRIDVRASITRRYRLEQINEAYEAMERGEIVGRAIVVM